MEKEFIKIKLINERFGRKFALKYVNNDIDPLSGGLSFKLFRQIAKLTNIEDYNEEDILDYVLTNG